MRENEPTVDDGTVAAEVELAPRRATLATTADELTVEQLVGRMQTIEQAMQAAMIEGVHYGRVPGVNKPTLFKPGAEMLNVLFRLAPSYESDVTWHDDGHMTVVAKCTLTHAPTGMVVAEGQGLATTRESKYAWRQGGRTCPACGAVGTIKKSKFPPRENDYPGASRSDPPGWYCHARSGGCGANFAHGDPAIMEQQDVGRMPNPDLPDTYNTVLKIADKRALVAGSLNATGASALFTQDVEDNQATRDAHVDTPFDGGLGTEGDPTEAIRAGLLLVPHAPRSFKAATEVVKALDPGGHVRLLDWIAAAITEYHGHPMRELDPAGRKIAGVQMANAVAFLRDDVMGGRDAPPPSIDEIGQALLFAFGVSIDGPLPEPEPPATDDTGGQPATQEEPSGGRTDGDSELSDEELEKHGLLLPAEAFPDVDDSIPFGDPEE